MNILKHTISFDPAAVLKQAEEDLQRQFKQRATREIENFCGEYTDFSGSFPKKIPGTGLLIIREFLEKKFDDPTTLERMEQYFNSNFDRIMEGAMEKALQHKANAFVFNEAKKR